jgi:hypothetical protein
MTTTMTAKRRPVDMTPEAVARRLDEVRQLCRLTRYLATFRGVEDEQADADPVAAEAPVTKG